jgi:hypothetical protein
VLLPVCQRGALAEKPMWLWDSLHLLHLFLLILTQISKGTHSILRCFHRCEAM